MPDPIPRNRSAQHRRPRRFAGPKSWRRRRHDHVADAEPALPQQCTVVGPPVYLDQPLPRTHEDTAPAPPPPAVTSQLPQPQPPPPQPASPIASPLRRPVPVLPPPDQPLRRTQDTTEPEQPAPPQPLPPQPPPPRPRPPAIGRHRPPRRVRLNARPPRPTRPRTSRHAGTDVLVGGSLLAGVALVMGLVLPLLPLGASTDSTATPPVSDRGDGSVAAPAGRNPEPVSEAPTAPPGAVNEVDHGPTHNGVALLADRSAARPDVPVTVNQPPPAQLPPPAPPAGVGNGQRVDPVTVDQGRQNTRSTQPDPGQLYPQPVPPRQPDTRPSPPPGATPEQRKQLEQFAKQLAALKQNSSGSPKPSSGQGTPNGTSSGTDSQRVKVRSGSQRATLGSKSPKTSSSPRGGSGFSGGKTGTSGGSSGSTGGGSGVSN